MRKEALAVVAICLLVGTRMYGQGSGLTCAKDDNCPTCKPGECRLWLEQKVGPGDYVYTGDPACAQDTNSQARDMVKALADSQIPGLSRYAGPFIDAATGEVQKFIKDNVRGGDIGRFLSGFTDPRANCQVVGLIIPTTAEVTGFEMWARDAHNSGEKCTVNQDCAGGWCKWTHYPVTVKQGDVKFVYGTFKNWSDDRERGAKLIIYFKPAEDWIPPR